MAKDMFWTVVTFGIIALMLGLAFWPNNKSHVVVVQYDCQALQADAPSMVLEECQKRNIK
jgi:hypothetical protein